MNLNINEKNNNFRMIKFVLTIFLMANLSLNISLKSVKQNVSRSDPKTRQLIMEEANMPTGNIYAENLENTSSNLNQMTVHGRRQTEMKQVGQWFLDIDERMDDYRDAVGRKLNELHMALSKPHIANAMNPMMGGGMMGGGMMNPMMSMFGRGSAAASKSGAEPVDEKEEEELEEKEDELRRMKKFMHI